MAHFPNSKKVNLDEEEIFKIVWKYINKNPDIRHMQLSELIPMALFK